jgi:hypothetical protein
MADGSGESDVDHQREDWVWVHARRFVRLWRVYNLARHSIHARPNLGFTPLKRDWYCDVNICHANPIQNGATDIPSTDDSGCRPSIPEAR